MPNAPARFLIIKTSSLGDIIQSWGVLDWIRKVHPQAEIHWVVEERCAALVQSHPLIGRAIVFDFRKRGFWRGLFDCIKVLRREKYDAVFDLQGNCKSGLLALLSRGNVKVGWGRRSVREWPNLLATRVRFEADPGANIRAQYLSLFQNYFDHRADVSESGVVLQISEKEERQLQALLRGSGRFMVCPGSRWANKQLNPEALREFIQKIESRWHPDWVFVFGSDREKKAGLALTEGLERCQVLGPMRLPLWQNLMRHMDLVIAMDSAALHLAGSAGAPTFSVFGPTLASIYKPPGDLHYAMQGGCPYDVSFKKVCPQLRTCKTGACMHQISGKTLWDAFAAWPISSPRNKPH